MSIYSKQINSLEYSDILVLLEDGAKENIRLEFKREYPSKDEILKKVSSLANTWGGYIVIGVEQDKDGKISALTGVDPKPGFHQQVIEWCYGGIYPPISPIITAPIKKDDESHKVFYVIYVGESYDAPHFLNGRKGCYIRTDEYSQLFEPQFAMYDEILHLSNRRQQSIDIREKLVSRAKSRFDMHVKQSYTTYENVVGDIDLTVWLAIVPTFPRFAQIDVPILDKAINVVRLRARDNIYPLGEPESQQDGYFFPDPRGINFAYLEVDTHGLIYYSQELGSINDEAQKKLNIENSDYKLTPSDIYFYSSWVIAWAIFYMKYASQIYQAVGYEGPITLRLGLDRIKGRKLRIPRDHQGTNFATGVSLFDDNISIDKSLFASALQAGVLDVCKSLFRAITFASGWKNAYSVEDDFIEWQIDRALDYLMWSRKDLNS
jgi:hypothetical protein